MSCFQVWLAIRDVHLQGLHINNLMLIEQEREGFKSSSEDASFAKYLI